MSVVVKALEPTSRNLRDYVHFGIDLYKGNDYFVPPLIIDEMATLDPKKNPAFDHCDAQMFMAYRDGRPVGRITAIINRLANEKYNNLAIRFGFMDFIDDNEVVDALFDAVKAWGRDRGCTSMVGPMGFSDLDREGMLVEGFDQMSTMATIYNYPYYVDHMQRLGFEKDADWVEFKIYVPKDGVLPDKFVRIAQIVQKKFNLKVKKYTDRKKLRDDYGQALFQLVNEAYDKLYGYVPLTPRQIDHYIGEYLGILRLDNVSVVTDADDQLVAVGISMPSLSAALRKCGGKLFPFGWWHLLRAIKGHSKVVDLLLVAVKPEYQNKGVNALLFNDLEPIYHQCGYEYADSNPELELNENVQRQWEYFEHTQHRRRRAWRRSL